MPIKPDKPNQQQEPDELDRRLAMSYRERYDLMMRLFRMGQMIKSAKVKDKQTEKG
jgi:hypothetical protein